MFAKFMTAGLVGSALLATVAFAQSDAAKRIAMCAKVWRPSGEAHSAKTLVTGA